MSFSGKGDEGVKDEKARSPGLGQKTSQMVLESRAREVRKERGETIRKRVLEVWGFVDVHI